MSLAPRRLLADARPGARESRRARARARRATITVGAALGAGLLAPPAAPALIQVDQGIAGARLGNTRDDVRTALGRPAAIRRGTNEFGPWLQYRYAGGIRVFFQGRREVTAVTTTGRGDRTARGVGVGSTEARVAARVPGVTCETIAGSRSCHTGDFEPGATITDFAIRGGRVSRVTVAIVID